MSNPQSVNYWFFKSSHVGSSLRESGGNSCQDPGFIAKSGQQLQTASAAPEGVCDPAQPAREGKQCLESIRRWSTVCPPRLSSTRHFCSWHKCDLLPKTLTEWEVVGLDGPSEDFKTSNVNLGLCDFHSVLCIAGSPNCEDLHIASCTCKYSINFQSNVSFYEANT